MFFYPRLIILSDTYPHGLVTAATPVAHRLVLYHHHHGEPSLKVQSREATFARYTDISLDGVFLEIPDRTSVVMVNPGARRHIKY